MSAPFCVAANQESAWARDNPIPVPQSTSNSWRRCFALTRYHDRHEPAAAGAEPFFKKRRVHDVLEVEPHRVIERAGGFDLPVPRGHAVERGERRRMKG
jgi:hypothetical protein